MKTKILFLAMVSVLIATACSSSRQEDKKVETEVPATTIELVYHVEGMTCDHCEMSIQKGVNELDGIVKVEANHEDSTTLVAYDPAKTNKEQIAQAIEKRGYKVID